MKANYYKQVAESNPCAHFASKRRTESRFIAISKFDKYSGRSESGTLAGFKRWLARRGYVYEIGMTSTTFEPVQAIFFIPKRYLNKSA